MTATTVPGVLLAAADVVERNGWYQGDFYDREAARAGTPPKGCPVCLSGAIRVVLYGDPTGFLAHDPLYRGARDALFDHPDIGPYCSLDEFNDAPWRTRAEVVSALRAAAKAVTTP